MCGDRNFNFVRHCAGAIDALTLLDKHIAPGCILLFDDLINYPQYMEHELKALWEWLAMTGRHIQVLFLLLQQDFVLMSCRFALLLCIGCIAAVQVEMPRALM